MKSHYKKIFLEDFWAARPIVRWQKSGKMVKNNAPAQLDSSGYILDPLEPSKYDYRSENKARRNFKKNAILKRA